MEAAGLASSILTFIEVSYKITKGAHEIYTSVSGNTEEHAHVINVISDLERASSRLAAPGRVDAEIASLSDKCRALSQELLDLLQKLQVKDKNVLRSFSVAFASARKQKEIASIEKRLDQYRQQILPRLTVLICQNQSPIQDQLVEIRRESEVLETKRALELEKLQNQIVELVQALKIQQSGTTALVKEEKEETKEPSYESTHATTEGEQQQPAAAEETTTNCPTPPKMPPTGAVPVLGDLSGLLEELDRLYGTVRSDNSVLRELYFDSISRREGNVHQAASETFHWIVGDVDDEEESQSSDTYAPDLDDSDNVGAEEETPDRDAEEKRRSKLDFEMMLQRETELRRATSETFMSL
ncbi:hypothetical protein CSOJ01_10753, partial [Colletotrichum sojae]